MDNSILLTQMIYTRISHDLSGAAGAVYNGTELLSEDLSFADQASGLIQSSADNLMKRLRFFRQTFGLQNKQDPDATSDYLSTFTMPFQISRACENNLERTLVMALTDVFYKGAKFELYPDKMNATGEALKNCDYLGQIFDTGLFEENANNAPAVFAYFLARQMHKKLVLTAQDNAVQINIQDE